VPADAILGHFSLVADALRAKPGHVIVVPPLVGCSGRPSRHTFRGARTAEGGKSKITPPLCRSRADLVAIWAFRSRPSLAHSVSCGLERQVLIPFRNSPESIPWRRDELVNCSVRSASTRNGNGAVIVRSTRREKLANPWMRTAFVPRPMDTSGVVIGAVRSGLS
jgi:hypothetical protein